MTMVLSAPLQTALFARLSSAPELATLNGRIYDDGVTMRLGENHFRGLCDHRG